MSSAVKWLQDNGVKFRKSGQELEVGCLNPECPNSGQPQMYINEATGAFYCHRCKTKGKSIKQLEFLAGIIKLQDPVHSKFIFITEEEISGYQEALKRNAPAIKFLEEIRGLERSTIMQFRLGYKAHHLGDCITIPYFDPSGICNGIKYYFYNKTDPKTPKIKFEKDSKIQAYNLNTVNLKGELIITEGEIDAMSMWQVGYKNVVSMPNGANGIGEWVDDLRAVDKFVLCTDNDSAGEEAAENLGKALGLSKCSRMYPPLNDINECLQSGVPTVEIDKRYKGAEPMFRAPITDIAEYQDKAEEMLTNPVVFSGLTTGWESLDKCLGGIREAEVTASSGLTAHGKTTFAMALIGNLIKDGVKCLIISPEMQESDLLLELANNHFRKNVDNVEDLNKFIEEHKQNVYIANVFDQWTNNNKEDRLLDRVFDIIDYSVKHKGVQFVLVDHLRLFLNVKGSDSERQAIDEFVGQAVHSAITTKAHIWLVVQPKNIPSDQRKITRNDLKGSSNIGQDSHNVVLIHRNIQQEAKDINTVEIEVAKCRSRAGNEGSFVLDFDVQTKANYYEGK